MPISFGAFPLGLFLALADLSARSTRVMSRAGSSAVCQLRQVKCINRIGHLLPFYVRRIWRIKPDLCALQMVIIHAAKHAKDIWSAL